MNQKSSGKYNNTVDLEVASQSNGAEPYCR